MTCDAVAANLYLIWPVMIGHGRGTNISQRQWCEPTRKSEVRVWKQTGTRQTLPPFNHTGLPLFYLRVSDHNVAFRYKRSFLHFQNIVERALDSSFTLKCAELNHIALLNPQTQVKMPNLKLQSSFLKTTTDLEVMIPKAQVVGKYFYVWSSTFTSLHGSRPLNHCTHLKFLSAIQTE